MVFTVPFAVTVKAEVNAVEACKGSEYVRVTVDPSASEAADTKVGPTASMTNASFLLSEPVAPGVGRSSEYSVGEEMVPLRAVTDA